MRDNKRLLVALSAILVLCTGLLAATLFLGKEEPTAEEEGEGYAVVHSLDTAKVTAFTLAGAEDTKNFLYTDNGWIYNDLADFPLNVDFMHSALETLSLIDAVEVVAEGVSDLSPYGLDTPQMRFSVTAGEVYSYRIGNYNSYNGYYYLCEEGGNTVFLVDADLPLLCGCDESDLITLGTLPDNYADGTVKRVNVNGTDCTEQALLDEMHAITLSDYEKYKVSEDDPAGAVRVSIYYAAASEDEYGTVSYSLGLTMFADEDHLLFTVDGDTVLYRLEKADYPEISKIIE